MKVVLHSTKTNLYYVAPNQWTADPKQARDFEQVHNAIRVDREERMTGMEVVLSYDDPFPDLTLPLRKFS
jgi:hypothetical protein